MSFDPVGPDSIDLREEFQGIMDRHGHWAILRRKADDRKTTSLDQQTHDDADLDNLGSGHAYVDIFVRIRKKTLFTTGEDPTPMGRQGTPLIIFYMQSQTRPSRGDFLVELAQDDDSLARGDQIQPTQPFQVSMKYDIEDVDDMRESGGRVEFFTVYTQVADLGDES